MSSATEAIRDARDKLLGWYGQGDLARREFRWPEISGPFNWAIDWFDEIGRGNDKLALWIRDFEGAEEKYSFDELVERSDRTAEWFTQIGVGKGDVAMLMLGNQVELWVTQLAAMKVGAIVLPTAQALQDFDLEERIAQAEVKIVITNPEEEHKFHAVDGPLLVTTGLASSRWLALSDAEACEAKPQNVVTDCDDPVLYYFTSGTTKSPKLVEHTQLTYPVGHLSTMYLLGLKPGDVHLNISSPGWGKHAWSSFFSPWLAEATVFSFNYERFDAAAMLHQLEDAKVTGFCAPPTVWRMMIQADLGKRPHSLRELIGAGEALNAEVIARVQDAWGLQIRDAYGQTETTCTVGNIPGDKVKPGSMGKPLPGVRPVIIDPETGEESTQGEITFDTTPWPFNLTPGYVGDEHSTVEADGRYHSKDLVSVDEDGYYTYVGRTDDVFKASDYKISPFELESVLIEHPAVMEAAVVGAPDPIRGNVPKAYVALANGHQPTAETASSILKYAKENLAPYLRLRRVEFQDLPKTISGKVRRVVLRSREHAELGKIDDFRYEHFTELRG